jgi:hypothetical protein
MMISLQRMNIVSHSSLILLPFPMVSHKSNEGFLVSIQ